MCIRKKDKKIKPSKKNNKINVIEDVKLPDYALSKETLTHSQSYSALLDVYVSDLKRKSITKFILKIIFFAATLTALGFVVGMFCVTVDYVKDFLSTNENLNELSMEAIFGILTVIVPAISSLIVAFIKIPHIIAKYLFDAKEDSYMNQIIKNIQNHDKSLFAMEHKVTATLAGNKKDSADDDFESNEVQSA